MSGPPAPIPPEFQFQQQPNQPFLLPGDPTTQQQLPAYPINPAAKPPKVHSCVLCQQRKVKCDRQSPCSNCRKARVECISSVSIRSRRRKRRFPEAELLARLRKYEDMLRELGVKLEGEDETTAGDGGHDGPPSDERDEGFEDGMKRDGTRRKTNVNGVWAAMSDEFRDFEEALQGSSSDETETPITRTYDSLYMNSDGTELLLGFPSPSDVDLATLHPNPVQIFQLWQTFLENIHPLLKLFHAPTIQGQIFQIAASLQIGNVAKEMEALMFGIYAFAVVTMDEAQCEVVFGSGDGVPPGGRKKEILAKFHYGCRIALVRADFMRSGDLTVLQAFLLYLHSIRQILDPRSLFLLTGLSVRIAQRLNLHLPLPLPPFETEIRRRLWWQLLLLDIRIAELSGAGTTSLTSTWSTPLPSNINDTDLYPAMTTAPIEHGSVTEMVFVLLRCELADFVRHQRSLPNQTQKAREKAINDIEAHLETKYLQHCDPNIPLHYIALLTARTQLAKMRLHSYSHSKLSPQDKDKRFTAALTMLQNLAACFTNRTIIGQWKWYIVMNIPLDAYIFILSQLRERTSGELADHAWATLDTINKTRDLTKRRGTGPSCSPGGAAPEAGKEDVMHQRLSSLAVKAWEAREKAMLQQGGQDMEVPAWIGRAKEEVRGRKSRGGTEVSASPEGSGIGNTLGTFMNTTAAAAAFGGGDEGGGMVNMNGYGGASSSSGMMQQGQQQVFGLEEYGAVGAGQALQMEGFDISGGAMGMGMDWGDYWGDVTDFY